jgi:hypothetical protein
MNQKVEKGAEPYIRSPIFLGTLHPGQQIDVEYVITNGAFEIIFTDEHGNPLKRPSPTIPACAWNSSQKSMPPCGIGLKLGSGLKGLFRLS